ncbi:MAG: hypothetical protein IJ074_10505 [Clostridia bacterium]|nr:hypothetical protein [Clostridia bacterium]
MKNDLISQSSEFDCGPTTLTNAMRFLYEREEIPPKILKHIWFMGNDTFDDDGRLGRHGTSKASMRYMADWLNAYGKGFQFPIHAEFLELEETLIAPGSRTWVCVAAGGCAVMRCYAGGYGHYVLLTQILPSGEIGLFDPYDEIPGETKDPWRCVAGEPKRMNRAVHPDQLNRTDTADYAMGAFPIRENLLIWRTDQNKEVTAHD